MRIPKILILNVQEGFLSDIVHLSYISVPWYRMSGGRFMLVPRFLPLRVWFLTILSIGNLSYVNPEGFLVPPSLNISLLGLTLNLSIGSV